MIAAVFHLELLRAGRRGRGYFLRWIYAAFLLAQIARMLSLNFSWDGLFTVVDLHAFIESFVLQHYVLIALLTPAIVCGAITEEKTHGTLQHLLTARVDPGEIIVGKLLFHMFQLGFWLLAALPVLCFFAGLARDVTFPVAVIATSLALAFGISGLSVLLSAWCRTTRDALLCVYLLLGAGVLLVPPLASTIWWFRWLNPMRILSFHDLALRWPRQGEFLLPWLYLGFFSALVASARLRQTYLRQLHASGSIKARWWMTQHGPVRGNPVLWREVQAARMAPLALFRRMPRGLGVLLVMVASAATLGFLLTVPFELGSHAWRMIIQGQWSGLPALVRHAGDVFFLEGLAALLVLTFVVAIRASASITGEKEKATWLALMVTSLTTREIITGKHRGIIWACVPYVAAHAAVTISLALALGFWAMTWAVAGVLLMLLVVILGGALGLWCSSRAASSWRSLVMTLTFFYLALVPVLLVWASEVILRVINVFPISGLTTSAAGSPSAVRSWAICVGLAAASWFVTRALLASAVARVGRKERWEMGFDDAQPARANEDDQLDSEWGTPPLAEEPAAVSVSSASQISDMLVLVTSREVERGELAQTRGDTQNAIRHYLAAAHMCLVLAEEYADNAQFESALRSRKNAVSCFWRAGHTLQARLLLEELKQENQFLSQEIDGVVLDLQPHESGWGPY
jgi:ABC-type transport system involved in multi-copper enzyme maturation permease subunit